MTTTPRTVRTEIATPGWRRLLVSGRGRTWAAALALLCGFSLLLPEPGPLPGLRWQFVGTTVQAAHRRQVKFRDGWVKPKRQGGKRFQNWNGLLIFTREKNPHLRYGLSGTDGFTPTRGKT